MDKRVPLESVGFDVDLVCVDGRHEDCIVGTPGGSTGELLLLCAASERLGSGVWASASVLSLASKWAATIGRLYMHTDVAAIRRVGATVKEVREGDPSDRRRLVDALTRPEGIGCSHLRLIRKYPERYAVRPKLLKAVLKAFLTLMWTGGNVRYSVLEGPHEEIEVLVLRSDALVQPHCQHDVDTRALAVHPDVQTWVRSRAAQMLVDFGTGPFLSGVSAAQLLAEMETIGAQWQDLTLAVLAPELPRRVSESP